MKKRTLLLAAFLLVGGGCLRTEVKITSFEECAAAGYPVMESYPRQCRVEGTTFVEVIAETSPPPESETPVVEVAYGSQTTLKVGQSARFSDGLTVKLMRIEDSRCAKDVVCIWAGELSPVLQLSNAASVTTELTLGTTTRKSVSTGEYVFELKESTEIAAVIVVRKK